MAHINRKFVVDCAADLHPWVHAGPGYCTMSSVRPQRTNMSILTQWWLVKAWVDCTEDRNQDHPPRERNANKQNGWVRGAHA